MRDPRRVLAVLFFTGVSTAQARGTPGDMNCDLVADGRDIRGSMRKMIHIGRGVAVMCE